MHTTAIPHERTLVLCPYVTGQTTNQRGAEGQREEALGLAEAISLDIVDVITVRLQSITPSSFFGSGKLNEINEIVQAENITLVIVDTGLSPVQQRLMEESWKCKVIDRTALILEIFGQRANTKEGRLQVELAQLHYQKGRLVRAWSHLERQRGGGGFTGGPGEKQIELDRRAIRDRIKELQERLEKVKRTRQLHRKTRRSVPYPIVSLVGYTNAGKSTLFNRLTGANVVAEDKLFATLDPTLRVIKLPSGLRVILSDTVGFVSNLPTLLVAAFRATLEEVLEATLVVHVRDISHPESEIQKQDVLHVLKSLEIRPETEETMVEALNKIDLLPEGSPLPLEPGHEGKLIPISAVTGEGVHSLLTAIEAQLTKHHQLITLTLSAAEGKLLAWLHAHASIREQTAEEDKITVTASFSPEAYGKFQKLLHEQDA